MNYQIKLTNAELHGVYVLEQSLRQAQGKFGAGSIQVSMSHSDSQAAALVVKKLMEAVEAGMVVKFIKE